MKALALAAAAGVLASAVVAVRVDAAGGVEQLYYGRTSQGRAASIDLIDRRTAGTSGKLAFRERYFLMDRHDTQAALPGGLRLAGGSFRFHTVVHEANNLRGEIWFDARRSGDGRTISGSYRAVVSQGGDSHTTAYRYSTVLWAASNGAPWSGATADGTPLTAAVRLLPSPEDDPHFTLTVAQLSLPVTCGGAPTTVVARGLQAPLRSVRGEHAPPTHGEYMFTNGLATAAPAEATAKAPDGTAVRIALALTRLRWQAGGLAAVGTITATGTGCGGYEATFALRPGQAATAKS